MGKKRRLAIIIALTLSVSMCFNTGSVWAKKSLTELQKELQKTQEELDKGLKKENQLADKVVDLEKQVYELNGEIEVSEVKLQKLEKELKKAQEKVDLQNEELGGRLRNMYKNGKVGFVDVLMNSGSFSEFLTNLDLVQKIYASDKDVLEELQEAHDEVEQKKEKVEKLTNELKSAKETASAEMAELEKQKKEIAADNKKTAAMMDELENEVAAVEAQLASQSGSGQISNSSSSSYEGGVFAWPVPSSTYISSEYGWRICPFHGKEFHGGLDIAASSGNAIIASADGTVISSGWNGGFGYSVQIDHGGGMVTMYNHCSALLVSVGQHVTRGQTIARIGSTGSSTGPHLDYRVFKNGSTVNPHSYL